MSNYTLSLSTFERKIRSLPQEPLPGDTIPKVSSYRAILPRTTRDFADEEKQVECLAEVCEIPDTEFCRQKLREIAYFRLKGYSGALRKRWPDESKAPFETVCRLYERDERMRLLLLFALQKIEVALRSELSYFYAQKYGPYGYLDKSHYHYARGKWGHCHRDFLEHLISSVKGNMDKPFVEHYLTHYDGVMPLWTVAELMPFGDLVRFYEDWLERDRMDFIESLYGGNRKKRESARAVSNGISRFSTWLKCCRKLRNVCAHCGQLYDRNFPWNPRLPQEFRRNRGPVTKKLWVAVLAVQFLYPDEREWDTCVVPRMRDILSLPTETDTALLLDGLGFPKNWQDWLNIWRTL